ncbi:MBL fold metallo-hydrolase [Alkalihalobacillus sp. AL-G]|uniref:MBL fold metallo-hydrolase n=1 Tax=Alkalihalobacillus sp. AL-G TaxID=2926399 RepID=UPI00272C10BA|nr:MBL fold metallo-hydrolase [Alkalihalobacillus sp. AL-G]WLD91944.1 MBL fold metallo-hydrolase [Alkalihalobacillus sp. AL-G]
MDERITCITLPTPFAVGDVNVYLIEGEKLTLVDTGPKTEETWTEFQRQIENSGYDVEDIQQVILTHHHPDHVGLSDFLKSRNVSFLSLAYNVPWLQKDSVFLAHHDRFYEKVYKEMGIEQFHKKSMAQIRKYLDYSCTVKIDTILQEGDEIEGLEGWKVLETPGHAQGHLSLFRVKDGIMVGGDHVIKHISSNALIEPPPLGIEERPKTLLQYRESLKKVIECDVKKVYSGHGEIVSNPIELVQERLLKQEERAERILEMIEGKALTGIEICMKLFPSIYLKELGLTMSETLGHLDLLQSNNKLNVANQNGVLYFQARRY